MISAQKVTIVNSTGEPLIINDRLKEISINTSEKKEVSGALNGVSIKNINKLDRYIYFFLEPDDKISVIVGKDNKITYKGDQASLHEYINEKLNIDTFGKISEYLSIIGKRNFKELTNTSEFLLLDILKKSNLKSISPAPTDSFSILKLKNHIKYNWLYTIFSSIDRENEKKIIKKEVITYYYKKYVEADIPNYKCTNFFHYHTIETLAKNKDLLQINLPLYSIVETTDADKILHYLPKDCQKFYFLNKYRYLDHINDPEKEYYKKILNEKFSNL